MGLTVAMISYGGELAVMLTCRYGENSAGSHSKISHANPQNTYYDLYDTSKILVSEALEGSEYLQGDSLSVV